MEASLPPIACISLSSEVSDLLFFPTLDTVDALHFSVELLFFLDQNSSSNEQSVNKSKNTVRVTHMNLKTFSILLLLLMGGGGSKQKKVI